MIYILERHRIECHLKGYESCPLWFFVSCFLKSDSHVPKKILFICFNENSLKMMKNAFNFILKALFVLKIFKFLTFWPCRRNGVIRKIRLIAKFLTPHSGKQTNTIHLLPNTSRSKKNQTLKFGQIIEYNNRNIYIFFF